ncbi:hypothetical protein LJC36_01795 [Desulfovibrio sp. OttesenSCG-928-C14]|nr:hypothetical protein [Desulfovibrio sp. OttesenSCG-928-C14]
MKKRILMSMALAMALAVPALADEAKADSLGIKAGVIYTASAKDKTYHNSYPDKASFRHKDGKRPGPGFDKRDQDRRHDKYGKGQGPAWRDHKDGKYKKGGHGGSWKGRDKKGHGFQNGKWNKDKKWHKDRRDHKKYDRKRNGHRR